MMRVLLDGWALANAPASPAALHTWALIARRPQEIELYLGLPGERLSWLPAEVLTVQQDTNNTPMGCLDWEQRQLPRLAHNIQADVLHTSGPSASLFSRLPCTNSPAYYPEQQRAQSFAGRLHLAAGRGGLNTARAQLWPADLPGTGSRLIPCPPFVHPEFADPTNVNIPSLALPETFVLYHGPHDETSLRRLLSAWGWAAGPIGDYFPLLLLGLGAAAQEMAKKLIMEYRAGDSVQILPDQPTSTVPAFYHRCAAVFHPAEIIPWGDPVMAALACGRPIAAAATPLTSSRAGSAAYLAPLDDPRALGAALLTLVVEEGMADDLAQAARQRASTWNEAGTAAALRALWSG
jgi:glycosyltransferase involved in cell wall biosynthesis